MNVQYVLYNTDNIMYSIVWIALASLSNPFRYAIEGIRVWLSLRAQFWYYME